MVASPSAKLNRVALNGGKYYVNYTPHWTLERYNREYCEVSLAPVTLTTGNNRDTTGIDEGIPYLISYTLKSSFLTYRNEARTQLLLVL